MGDINIKPLFIVIFKDNSQFIGGTSYFDTKWLEIPFKPIKRIFLHQNVFLDSLAHKSFGCVRVIVSSQAYSGTRTTDFLLNL